MWTAAPGIRNTAVMPGTPLSPQDVRLMQGLAQQVTALRPELVNSDATVGELAWGWGKDHAAWAAPGGTGCGSPAATWPAGAGPSCRTR